MRMVLLAMLFGTLSACAHEPGPRPVYYQCFESAAVAAAFPHFIQATVAASPLDYEALTNVASLEIVHRRILECHGPQVTAFLHDPVESEDYERRSDVQRELSRLATMFAQVESITNQRSNHLLPGAE